MEIDTITTRFIKKFGPPYPTKRTDLTFMMGGGLPSFGLSFNPTTIEQFKIKYGKDITILETEPVKILPALEYQCRDREDQNNIICSFSTKRLIAGLSVLDSKPYSRCSVKFTVQEFPMFITRQIRKESAIVIIAPEEWTIRQDGYLVPENPEIQVIPEYFKVDIVWLNQIPDTTWWIAKYTDHRGYSEYVQKCTNCGMEKLPSDHRVDHPLCDCWCGCDDCERLRNHREYIDQMQWYSRKKWQ